MRGKFVGIKHISGTSKKDDKPFAFSVAVINTEMSERDINNGAKGEDSHTVTIPDRLAGVLNDANVGKDVNVEFYYANNRENLAFADLATTK